MITVVSGTNRPDSNTRKVAALIERILTDLGEDVALLDLIALPAEVFAPTSYSSKPASFAPFRERVLDTDGLLTVVPEYNGSFPGVLKYFIDMLPFPESLHEKPAAFVGISSGRWGGVRAVEQLEMIFQHRHAHLFGRRCFIPGIGKAIDETGQLIDRDLADRLRTMVAGYARFCTILGRGRK
jgi:NAD(P)H-dependent FMN reductase